MSSKALSANPVTAHFVLVSEFAATEVYVDRCGNGDRLAVHDLRTGRIAFFDPLELETLVWLDDDDRERLMDPAATRW